MWLLVGAGALLLVIFVINEVSSFALRRRGQSAQPDEPSTPAGTAAAGNRSSLSLDEADRLAREGRYAEALHMLLLDCFAQLRRLRFDAVIAPSLTSRELTRRLTLPEPSARALAAIVSAVELSHFGGRLPGEDEYRRCRQGLPSDRQRQCRGRAMSERAVFAPRTVFWLVTVGTISFVGALVLSLLVGDGGSVRSADANTFSYSAIGHRAFVEILERVEMPVLVSRYDSAGKAGASSLLVIAEPAPPTATATALKRLLSARECPCRAAEMAGRGRRPDPRMAGKRGN